VNEVSSSVSSSIACKQPFITDNHLRKSDRRLDALSRPLVRGLLGASLGLLGAFLERLEATRGALLL